MPESNFCEQVAALAREDGWDVYIATNETFQAENLMGSIVAIEMIDNQVIDASIQVNEDEPAHDLTEEFNFTVELPEAFIQRYRSWSQP